MRYMEGVCRNKNVWMLRRTWDWICAGITDYNKENMGNIVKNYCTSIMHAADLNLGVLRAMEEVCYENVSSSTINKHIEKNTVNDQAAMYSNCKQPTKKLENLIYNRKIYLIL